jgi:hypothetical protein
MKSIRELKQEKVTLFNQAKAIKDQADKETRSMNQEEQNNWNAVMDKWTALKTDIDQRQRLEEMESEVNSAESRSVNRPDSSEGQEQGEQRGMFDLSTRV